MNDLHTKYRPKTLEEVVGQEATIKSLQSVLKRKSCRAFTFVGPSGCGKTTLARVVALTVGCDPKNITEINGALRTGIDDMRDVLSNLHFSAIGKSPKKMYIIDEAHRLSAGAWSSLLVPVEEPPPNVYWAFCTTEAGKIPSNFRTGRCTQYAVTKVSKDDLFDLLVEVSKKEGLKTSEEVLYFIAEKSEGSPRQALTCLSQCARCTTRKEAASLIRIVSDDEDGEARELCQALIKNAEWPQLMKILDTLSDISPESIRYCVINYFSKVAKGAKTVRSAESALAILDAFSEPYPQTTQQYPLILSLGRLLD